MLRALSVAATLLMLPAAASAELRAQQPIDELVAELAYDLCPLYLDEELALNSPELAERGFNSAVRQQEHPQLGDITLVAATRADGGVIGFGGVAGRTCTVVVQGPNLPAVMTRLRADMAQMELEFQPTLNLTQDILGVTVQTFKALVEPGVVLYVQLLESGGPAPAVIAQLFAMEE